MSRDYKSNDRKPAARSGGGSFFLGMLVGLVLGLAIALGIAWYINKMPNPFQKRPPTAATATPPAAEKAEPAKNGTAAKEATTKAAPESKTRFDFYKILPGKEEPATDQQLRESTKDAGKESFYLQAGAFQNSADADNLKARLALIGMQANIQTSTLPDRGIWHRVRIGPYASVEELNQARDTLKKNGIDTTLIKVRGQSR